MHRPLSADASVQRSRDVKLQGGGEGQKKKSRKKRHAGKHCRKAEQIKQRCDLLGFVLAKNAPCILIRSAVQLALTALLMPFRRSELSLFQHFSLPLSGTGCGAVWGGLAFFFACLIAESAAGEREETRGGGGGRSADPAAHRVPTAPRRGVRVYMCVCMCVCVYMCVCICVFSRKSFLGALQA